MMSPLSHTYKHSGDILSTHSATTDNCAQLDVTSASRHWRFERALFDMTVFNLHAPSKMLQMAAYYHWHERQKRHKHEERYEMWNRPHFYLVMYCTGGAGQCAPTFFQEHVAMQAEKHVAYCS